MKAYKKIFAVWNTGTNGDPGYWVTYSSLEEAVLENEGNTKVFEATLKETGTFKAVPKMLKTPNKRSTEARQ